MVSDFLLQLEGIFRSSRLLGLGASYCAGVIVSFSPCIYPLIPVTLGIIGATAASSRLKGFTLSFVYVLGISFTYTVLGITASLLGVFLQRIFVNPVTYSILAMVFLALGFSLLGIVRINIPIFVPQYSPRKTFLSLFILGMVSALAMIPCNFPVLGAVLSLISLQRDVLYGGAALFLFSLGYGFILLVIGMSASLMSKLPTQGTWLIILKKASGIILIGMGGYFLFKFITILI